MKRFSLAKIRVLKNIAWGYISKALIDLRILRPRHLPPAKPSGGRLIATLTSYGRRVNDGILYYSLVSILRQKRLPDKIVVWLADNEFSDDTLPKRLLELKSFGVEFKYCPDYGSYKKLLPSLKEYPDDCLITFDDDFIYSRNIIGSLEKAHRQHPDAIIAYTGAIPEIEGDKFTPYVTWNQRKWKGNVEPPIMPLGGSGTLYPPQSLNNEIFSNSTRVRTCPLADDIWFWIMAKLRGTGHIVVAQGKYFGSSFDTWYQYRHQGSALNHINRKENLNDDQLNWVLKEYNLTPKQLLELSSCSN